jgi:hypothetical protein
MDPKLTHLKMHVRRRDRPVENNGIVQYTSEALNKRTWGNRQDEDERVKRRIKVQRYRTCSCGTMLWNVLKLRGQQPPPETAGGHERLKGLIDKVQNGKREKQES